ncbi:hypothetical protein SETIT_2G218800v2 [Setaria italica]|uniref:F-box domain-containing protein n=1 Tax=Setaria italica TaxID=4555 RepID=A0A368Q1T9_SETIT|nr:hypothetical protein SETIT_2G218800v2 [Setaria italica]
MPSSLEGGQAQEQENKITMGTYSEGDIAGGCRGSGTDRICGLPDNLLHSIVLRLPGTADAARTSVLARSWRGVWAQLPELMFPPYALTRWSGSRSLVNSRAVFRLQPRSFKHFVHSLSDFHIAAPKLSEVYWNSSIFFVYDPSRHHFTESGHHLQWLVIAVN